MGRRRRRLLGCEGLFCLLRFPTDKWRVRIKHFSFLGKISRLCFSCYIPRPQGFFFTSRSRFAGRDPYNRMCSVTAYAAGFSFRCFWRSQLEPRRALVTSRSRFAGRDPYNLMCSVTAYAAGFCFCALLLHREPQGSFLCPDPAGAGFFL